MLGLVFSKEAHNSHYSTASDQGTHKTTNDLACYLVVLKAISDAATNFRANPSSESQKNPG